MILIKFINLNGTAFIFRTRSNDSIDEIEIEKKKIFHLKKQQCNNNKKHQIYAGSFTFLPTWLLIFKPWLDCLCNFICTWICTDKNTHILEKTQQTTNLFMHKKFMNKIFFCRNSDWNHTTDSLIKTLCNKVINFLKS